MLTDVAVVLQRLEEARQQHGAGNEGAQVASSLVALMQRIENRVQLDQLVAGLPAGTEVAQRTDEALTVTTELTDSELLALAQSQIDAMTQRANDLIAPAVPSDIALVERLRAVPIVVLDHAAATSDGFRVDGRAYDIEPSPRTGALTDDDLDRLSELDFQWQLLGNMDHAWNHLGQAFTALADHQHYVERWLLEPATTGGVDAEPVFRLWQAGAELWIQVDRVAVVRSAASRPNAIYRSTPRPPEHVDDELSEWIAQAGPHGGRVLELVGQASDAVAAGRPAYLYLDGLDLSSVPPVHNVQPWTLVTIANNPGIDLSGLSRFTSLTDLAVTGCDLSEVPAVVRQHRSLTGLVLSNNPIAALPHWLSELRSLERLAVSATGLTDLPSWLGDLPELRCVIMDACRLQQLPDALTSITGLNELRFESNQIVEFPSWLTSSAVQHVHLRDNRITELPGPISQMQTLKVLDLSNNPLATLPPDILDLPDDCKLVLRRTNLPPSWQRARTIGELRIRQTAG